MGFTPEKDAMPDDTPPNRHRIRIGEIYFQWDRDDRHHLALDLSGPLPAWVVEAAGEVVPLGEYLGRHPGRREEVRQLIRLRLEAPGQEGRP
jgi:hypothetical protein